MSFSQPLLSTTPAKHTATVIFLHGLGDSGRGWFSTIKMFASNNPEVRIVCPTAPVQAVTCNGGHKSTSWHDIARLENLDNEKSTGVENSVSLIHGLIDEEAKLVPAERIILGGFSQGAAMSILAGFSYTQKLAGIVALSGYIPRFNTFNENSIHPNNKTTKALVAHGESDGVVDFSMGKRAAESLQQLGVPVDFLSYRNLGHSSSQEEMSAVFRFFGEALKQ